MNNGTELYAGLTKEHSPVVVKRPVLGDYAGASSSDAVACVGIDANFLSRRRGIFVRCQRNVAGDHES